MEDEDNRPSSFHGALSHFAYTPPSPSLLQTLRRAPDKVARPQNGVQSCGELDGDDRNQGSYAPTAAKSLKRKGERLGSGSRSPRPKKPKEEGAAGAAYSHLNAVPDNITEDLDGTHNTHNLRESDPFLTYPSPGAVLFCGIKYVNYLTHVCRLSEHHAVRAVCPQSGGTTMQIRQTISGLACISLVRV